MKGRHNLQSGWISELFMMSMTPVQAKVRSNDLIKKYIYFNVKQMFNIHSKLQTVQQK